MVAGKQFSTKILGDIDLEGMIILICYDDEIIAEINYEKGVDNMEIEIIDSEQGCPNRFFPLKGFLEILQKAQQLALKCANEDTENSND